MKFQKGDSDIVIGLVGIFVGPALMLWAAFAVDWRLMVGIVGYWMFKIGVATSEKRIGRSGDLLQKLRRSNES